MKQLMVLTSLAIVASPVSAQSPSSPTPLFSSDTALHLKIQGPIATLASNRAEVARAGVMTVDGAEYPITLSPRGITRRTNDICEFPPLRVELTSPAPNNSLLDHQKRLKLVTHCQQAPDFQQKVLLEYAAYRLYNLMTPQSFRARLANIDYVDDRGRPFISRVGFFIEDFGDVARRNGMSNAHQGSRVPLASIDRLAAARFAIFEYMISNYDWAMIAAPKGEECCHNARLMAGAARTPLIPVPYDFDYSGLVDAPYAVQPEIVPISNVRQRYYRGYCMHLDQARAVAAELAPRRAEFTGLFATIPGLDARNRSRAAAYIDSFFNDLGNRRIFRNCL